MNCIKVHIVLIFFVGKIIVVKCNEPNSYPRLTTRQKFQILQNYFKHRDRFSLDNSEKRYDQIVFRRNSIDDSISLMKPTTKWSSYGMLERIPILNASDEKKVAAPLPPPA